MGLITLEPQGGPPAGAAARVPFKRLLVPLDGSPFGEQVLPFAQSLARTLDADMILVRVASKGQLFGGRAEAQAKAAAEAQAYLVQLASAYRTDYAVEYSVPMGDPVVEIPEVARLRAADLVVMATHGRAGLGRLLLGSVADGLLRRGGVPLLLIRDGLPVRRWKHGLRRILVPLDGSELAEAVVPRVSALARAAGARLTLLQVVGPVMPELKAYEIVSLPADDHTMADQAQAYLQRMAAPLERSGLHVQTSVVLGTPGDQIVATAGQGYDLVAMSTHGRGGIDRLMVGSVADQVLRAASVPILLLGPRLVPSGTSSSNSGARSSDLEYDHVRE